MVEQSDLVRCVLEFLMAWAPTLIFLVLWIFLKLYYEKTIYKKLEKVAQLTATKYDDIVLEAAKWPVYAFGISVTLLCAVIFSPLAIPRLTSICIIVFRCVVVFTFTWFVENLLSKKSGFLELLYASCDFQHVDIGVNISSPILRFVVLICAIVLVGKEFNYDVTMFFASLSLGSFAIALAAKDALANVFGSMVILLDKPLVQGEWVLANGVEGIVEDITFRATTIRKFSQELVYIPNSMLISTPIVNYSRMDKRRADFTFNVDYTNRAMGIERFLEEIRLWLGQQEFAISRPNKGDNDAQKAHVNFVSYGKDAAVIRVIVYVNTHEFYSWLKTNNDINLGIMKIAERNGINISVNNVRIFSDKEGGQNEYDRNSQSHEICD